MRIQNQITIKYKYITVSIVLLDHSSKLNSTVPISLH